MSNALFNMGFDVFVFLNENIVSFFTHRDHEEQVDHDADVRNRTESKGGKKKKKKHGNWAQFHILN